MRRTSEWSDQARANLLESLTYIREQSPRGAQIVAARIQEKIEQLCGNPRLGRPFELDSEIEVREAVVAPYILRYIVYEDHIFIAAFWHGAQLPPGVEVPDEDDAEASPDPSPEDSD